jgi:hypothetical protein
MIVARKKKQGRADHVEQANNYVDFCLGWWRWSGITEQQWIESVYDILEQIKEKCGRGLNFR